MTDDTPVAATIPAHWFPFTKFQPPQLRSESVERPSLEARLAAAVVAHRFTLVAAPAGSGKTVLAATLLVQELRSAWVTLDSGDDDVPVFVALLAMALRAQLQDGGQSILSLLRTVPYAEEVVPQLANMLINQLRPAAAPLVLILDDYYAIENAAVHAFIAHLVDYAPPDLRLVVTTRHDPPLPLARWRMRGHLAEIRLADLRFDRDEAAALFGQGHHLQLAAGEVAHLVEVTEGWVAGLQLLGSVLAALPPGDERSAYIAQLGPTNRSIFDLLAAEVFALQPPDVQAFLLQTSILAELTPENCAAVTGQTAVLPLLATVYQRNLFLRALSPDARTGPFRYHDLFAGFLQQRLREEQPQLWHELHRRAAAVAATDEQKLAHLMQAGLWTDVAALLEEMGYRDTERRVMRRVVTQTIEQLPEGLLEERPWLSLFVAQYYGLRGHQEQATPWRERAERGFREQGDEVGQVEVLIARAMTDSLDTEFIVREFRQKVAAVGSSLRPDQIIVYHGIEQWHAEAQQDWATLTEHSRAIWTQALASGDPGALAMAGLVTAAPQILFNDDGVALPERFARRCLEVARPEDWVLQICGHALVGFVEFYAGRVVAAEAAIKTAYEALSAIGGRLAWIDDHIAWLIMTLAITRRDYRSFDAFAASQEPRWSTQATAAGYRKGFLYLMGCAYLLRNRPVEARQTLRQIDALPAEMAYPTEDNERRHLLLGRLAAAEGDVARAESELRSAIRLHQRVRHTFLLNHPRLTLATVYAQLNRWDEALHAFRIGVQEIKGLGMPGIILQEGESIVPVLERAITAEIEPEMLRPLLAILQPDAMPRALPIPDSQEHLTPREVDVLRLLATGATNPQIAAQLVITERTVKAHVGRILGKLGAANRTEAVAVARKLGLI